MKLKVGDKVKFLNERGGGVIRAIIDSKMVRLETEDGFEMPVLASELIRDYRAEKESGTEYFIQPSAPVKTERAEEPEEGRISGINPWGTVKEEKGIYLAYEPHERQWVLTGDLDIVLINHTSFEVLYNLFFLQDGIMRGVDYGSVPYESKIVIDTINRDEIENWTKGFIQLSFHKDEPRKVYLPAHCVINIKPSRFYKEGSYQSSTLLQGKTILISIAPQNTLQVASDEEEAIKAGIQHQSVPAEPLREKQLIDKHRSAAGEAVVDLHIGEIVDNISGLKSQDMFNLQMDYFRKSLESAIKNDYRKVTFIHGIGNGVLKNAIIKEMEHYEGIENRMANITKFGAGAIDVLIGKES
ncbi:MAG: DUF2027 domain-containing protein [bacterium]